MRKLLETAGLLAWTVGASEHAERVPYPWGPFCAQWTDKSDHFVKAFFTGDPSKESQIKVALQHVKVDKGKTSPMEMVRDFQPNTENSFLSGRNWKFSIANAIPSIIVGKTPHTLSVQRCDEDKFEKIFQVGDALAFVHRRTVGGWIAGYNSDITVAKKLNTAATKLVETLNNYKVAQNLNKAVNSAQTIANSSEKERQKPAETLANEVLDKCKSLSATSLCAFYVLHFIGENLLKEKDCGSHNINCEYFIHRLETWSSAAFVTQAHMASSTELPVALAIFNLTKSRVWNKFKALRPANQNEQAQHSPQTETVDKLACENVSCPDKSDETHSEELRKADEARLLREFRNAEEARLLEEARLDELRKTEETRVEEQTRLQELQQAGELRNVEEALRLQDLRKAEQERRMKETGQQELRQAKSTRLQEDSRQKELHNAENALILEDTRLDILRLADEARLLQHARQLEELRQAEEARLLEQVRVDVLRQADQARVLEETHQEELRKAEQARLLEETRLVNLRLADEARLSEKARQLEELRKAEEARLLEQVRLEELRQADAARHLENTRLDDLHNLEQARLSGETRLDELRRTEDAQVLNAARQLEVSLKAKDAHALENLGNAEQARLLEEVRVDKLREAHEAAVLEEPRKEELREAAEIRLFDDARLDKLRLAEATPVFDQIRSDSLHQAQESRLLGEARLDDLRNAEKTAVEEVFRVQELRQAGDLQRAEEALRLHELRKTEETRLLQQQEFHMAEEAFLLEKTRYNDLVEVGQARLFEVVHLDQLSKAENELRVKETDQQELRQAEATRMFEEAHQKEVHNAVNARPLEDAGLEELRKAKHARLLEDIRQDELRNLEQERVSGDSRLKELRLLEAARQLEVSLNAKDARVLEELGNAEHTRLEEFARAGELHEAEKARHSEELRLAHEARLSEQARQLEEFHKAEEVRRLEELRIADESRKAKDAIHVAQSRAEALRQAGESSNDEKENSEALSRVKSDSSTFVSEVSSLLLSIPGIQELIPQLNVFFFSSVTLATLFHVYAEIGATLEANQLEVVSKLASAPSDKRLGFLLMMIINDFEEALSKDANGQLASLVNSLSATNGKPDSFHKLTLLSPESLVLRDRRNPHMDLLFNMLQELVKLPQERNKVFFALTPRIGSESFGKRQFHRSAVQLLNLFMSLISFLDLKDRTAVLKMMNNAVITTPQSNSNIVASPAVNAASADLLPPAKLHGRLRRKTHEVTHPDPKSRPRTHVFTETQIKSIDAGILEAKKALEETPWATWKRLIESLIHHFAKKD